MILGAMELHELAAAVEASVDDRKALLRLRRELRRFPDVISNYRAWLDGTIGRYLLGIDASEGRGSGIP